MTRTTNLRLLKLIGAIILIGIIVVFAISRSLNYARGPEIIITEPKNGSTITILKNSGPTNRESIATTVTISGQAQRINAITLNGNPISIDEAGNWKDVVVIFPGLNKITVSAKDRFGRSIDQRLELVGNLE